MDMNKEPRMNESLRLFTQRITKIPTIPPVASCIIGLLGNSSACMNNVVDIIEKDPAISAKIIGLSNSAFFRRGNPVGSIGEAIMNIGFDNVKNIALGISLLTVFISEKNGRKEEYIKIFRHCLAVGLIAREIGKSVACGDDDNVFTGGLLHDLGLMIIHNLLPDMTVQIARKLETGLKYPEAEMDILGVSHGEVGAWLADKWNIPESIYSAIYYHHNVSAAGTYMQSAAIVHLADNMALKKGYRPLLGAGYDYPLDERAIGSAGISGQAIAVVENKIDDILSVIEEIS
jgi:putative nucleotidyltransferase with HDIG domain